MGKIRLRQNCLKPPSLHDKQKLTKNVFLQIWDIKLDLANSTAAFPCPHHATLRYFHLMVFNLGYTLESSGNLNKQSLVSMTKFLIKLVWDGILLSVFLKTILYCATRVQNNCLDGDSCPDLWLLAIFFFPKKNLSFFFFN